MPTEHNSKQKQMQQQQQQQQQQPETVDAVKRGLEKLDLVSTTKSNTAAPEEALSQSDQPSKVVLKSMEQSIDIVAIDPLSVDLPQSIKLLESQLAANKISVPESGKAAMQKLNQWAGQTRPRSDKPTVAKVLNRISALLLAEGADLAALELPTHNRALWSDGRFTLLVAMVFRPLIVELVARWTQAEAPASVIHQLGSHVDAAKTHLSVSYAAGIIVGTAPQVRSLIMWYFQNRANEKCLAQIAAAAAAAAAAAECKEQNKPGGQILAVALRLLRRMPEAADGVAPWDWQTSLSTLMAPENDAQVRILASECMSVVRGLTDSGRTHLQQQMMECDPAMVAALRAWAVYGEQQFDLLAQQQMTELNRTCFEMGLWRQLDCNISNCEQTWLSDSDLSSCVANVGGVLLHAHELSTTSTGGFVLTPTVSANVHEVALATSRREPVLLQGPAGSGKTSLVEWVARRTGHELITIHLSSSMDAKVLLGNYVTTQRAGDFEWRAGLLTTAVTDGQWVLIEDIDLAPPDVVQTLVPLLESHTLFVPSRGEAIRAHIRFRLFATLSTHARGSNGSSRVGVDGLLGSSMWTRLLIGSLDSEMPLVVAGAYPDLSSHANELATAFAQVADAVAANSGAALGRSASTALSTRDLLKWCARLQAYGSNDAFRLFQEAVDAFAMREADYDRWRALVHRIGAVFALAPQRIDNFADQYAPETVRTGNELRIGRARLTVLGPTPDERMPFADTRHSRCLLERIASCVQLGEPVLLSGETGTGKTTVVQHLAALSGRPLAVFNLSQQSDSSDLLGGFRPVDIALVALQLREAFDALFARTVSVRKNAAFLDSVRVAHGRRDWRRLAGLFAAAVKMAQQVIDKAKKSTASTDDEAGRKRARLTAQTVGELDAEWQAFAARADAFDALRGARMVFGFVEGALVTAARTGGWILLDEVNLAAAETLACLGGLLQAERTIVLAETGERVRCHPDFRLFACMNPANDVGKRDLPPGLRSSFAEFFVHPPDASTDDLLAIVRAHLPATAPPAVCHRIIAFYRAAKRLASEHQLVDGANQRPHYSLRTLTRALTYARDNAPAYSLKRALYDGLCMTFATQLAGSTQPVLLAELAQVFDGDALRQMLAHVPPARNADAVLVQGFWLPSLESDDAAGSDSAYVMTASVEAKLRALARAVMCGRYPVLIQGPTSAGKTSMVQHLARLTGHRFVRINNHEHTDLQEYLGAYASVDGRLVFQEGLLVRALREGHWLVLDELNLAPSDVLEALNRLLDDNRELVIPETQEVVRPHPHFMLFATQNPAGLYGGRKALSRAFRNRFVELHFDDIPERELQQIIVDSCQVPPSHAALLVAVYRALTQTRAQTRIFEASHGFITLRDLFRWANRRATSKTELAEHGFMLLAERVRTTEEKTVVLRAIERVFFPSSAGDGSVRRNTGIDVDALYSEARLHAMPEYQAFVQHSSATQAVVEVAWTKAMRRLFVLTALCLRFHEPVLLVGETGCGKTTVCQMLAQALSRRLHVVNCHQNTESSDILGGQRPVRNRAALVTAARERVAQAGIVVTDVDSPEALDALFPDPAALSPEQTRAVSDARELLVRAQSLFAWHDGPLVQAMRQGDVFLMDELNLADDSVLERLNSVLEPSRTLVLAEQAGASTLAAVPGFEFVATMNPGGDYGKRELSPALRNRFTELWAPATTDTDDLSMILAHRLQSVPEATWCTEVILDFVAYLSTGARVLLHPLSLRDYLFWADFVVRARPLMHDAAACVVHGACLVLLDAVGTQGSLFSTAARAPAAVKNECIAKMCAMVGWDPAMSQRALGVVPARSLANADLAALIERRDNAVGVAPFFVAEGALAAQSSSPGSGGFALHAPTTFDNLVKVLRAMQVGKPLLLEGSPGVGKTTLVSALARLAGHRLVRINLSDQTDLMDLFGSDLPVDGGFAWCDAPFLQALKRGDWVLLDEINLASQSVLEGLNSCLDHRGSVYISELDREFTLSPGFRLFAAQNPLGQGGGRKGLPRSFVNRFTQVFMDELTRSDLHVICDRMYNSHPSVGSVLEFNWRMHNETMVRRSFGASGSPWEFNLRDVSRFMELALEPSALDAQAKPVADFVEMLYVHRMRTDTDRRRVRELYQSVFGLPLPDAVPSLHMTERLLQVGGAVLPRRTTNARPSRLRALHAQLPYLESLMRCIEKRWMAILVGPAGCGKTSLVRWLATATGNHLVEFSMNAGVDTSEILGGFEQVDLQRHCAALVHLLALITEQATLGACFQDSEQASLVARISALCHQAADSNVSVSVLCAVAGDITRLADGFPALNELCARVRTQAQALAALEVAGKFEWVDGVLVDALVNGHWLLIDRANLCSASVLDRLNGLLEPNGVLYVNEDPKRTSAVVPHPDFRIIMAVDPLYGELSRAMRNRGIEICVLPQADQACVLNDQRAVAHAIGVPAKLLQGPVVPEPTTTALVQQAMHVAERVQRGYYAASNTVDGAADDDTLVLLARAPASPAESSVSIAAWQTALARLAVSTGSPLASSRMVLAVLATLPPSASAFGTTCLRAVTNADPIGSALAKLIDIAPVAVAEAISRARQMLAHESGIHVDVLASAPLCIALNSGIQRILARQTQKESSNNLAMLWHQALTDTLVFRHERTSIELSSSAASGLSADLRELVLQRPSVDIAFVQSIFALIDGCQRILDAWEPAVVGASEPEVGSGLAQFVPALRSLHRLKLRIEHLLSLDRGAASELAVAFENLQPVLIRLQTAPGDVGREAAGLLLASVDGLVLDASFSARVWQLQHPVTLADDDARALEQQLIMAAASLAHDTESDPMLRDAVTEALAMLFATASRKDQHLVRAAIRRFAQTLPESPEPSTNDHGALAAPADVIADVVELGHWQRIVHMVAAVASSSAAASDSALFNSLSDLVSTASVKEGSSWSLLYTRLCWALNDPQQTGAAQLLPLLTDLSHHWFEQLDARALDTLLTSPDRRLLQPVGTELTWKQAASLDCSLATYERAALHSRQLLASFATYRPFVRSAANELALLVAGVVQTARAVSSSLSSDCTAELAMRSELLVKALENNTATEEQRHGWLELVRQATASVSDVVSSAVDSVQSALASFSLAAIYRASIQVALCQLAISIPKRPVDPAAKARTQWTWLGDEIEEAQADLDAFQKIQLSMTGESVSAATQPHAQRLSELERAQSGIELVYRPAKSQATASFAELWQEAHNLMANVLGRARDIAAQLVPMSVNTATDDDDERFSMSVDEFGRVDAAAQAVLNTLRQFESRVVKRYFSAFRDVAQIWCVQVRQIAYSLVRLVELRRIQVNRQTAEYAVLVNSLYAQPMTNVVVAVAATGSSNSGELLAHLQTVLAKLKTLIYFTQGSNGGPLKTYGQLLVTLLSRVVLAVQVRGALTPHELAALNSVFGDAYDIHKRAVDEKRKRDAEAASLFKSKVTKEPTDDELLNELFPGYDDIYEPESEDAEDGEKKLEPSYQDLSDEVVAALAACHQYVMLQFGGSMQGASDVRRTLILDAQRQAFELAASLYQLKPEIASIQTARADSELRGANIVSLASVAAATTAAAAATAAGDSGVRMVNVYNFYKDPSTSEAVLLKPLVSGIVSRVKSLLDEWPEHAVLQQIRDMCERLLEFPVNTPLAKLLAGLELLHQRAQDWQAFASRDVAIEELGDVARLIIRWRQTELNSWPHLLRAQELEFARRPNEWWFGLYAALVVPESAEFNDLVSAIDQFMQGSPAGEYRGRLNMLCAFAGHRMAVLAAQAQQQGGHSLALLQQKDSVYGPLTNAIDYYAQFASCIHDHLERAGKSIRKDLAQYVKISSWKDVNPAALRASAQKTHRHLTKCIKMWREALSQPIFQIIQLQQTASIATARVPLVQIVSLPLNNAGFDIEPPRSIAAMSGGRTLALPWTVSDDLDISPELAASVARMASSTSMARVLEASPSTLQQLVRMMTRSTVFYVGNVPDDSSSSSSSSSTNVDVLEEFALQIVGDVSYFQSVETPKHLVKPSSTKTASSKPSQQQQTASASSKKLLIKSKKQRESEQEAAAEYIEDDDERQRRIKQFWGEQRNLRRTRLKEILKGMQELGLKRHFRATAAAAQQDSTAKGSSLIGLSAMLQQAPLDVAAWHRAAAASLAVESSSVHAHTPEAHRNWQLANAGFFRLCSQLAQLRSASFEEHSQEVNGQQVMQILSLMESLAHNVAGDRRCAAELLANAAAWMQASIGWTATPMASADVAVAEPTVERLKDSVDALVSLMHQFVVSARAVDGVGGWGANAALVGQAIGAASSAADRLTQAAGSLAAVNSAFVSLKLAGVQPVCALAQLQQLQQTEDARQNVRDAVAATQQALAAVAESGLDPWVLAPWIDPISRATEQLAEAAIAAPPELIEADNAAPEPLAAHLAELSGQLATGTMHAWQAIHRAEKQFAEHDAEPNQWGLATKELVHRLELMNQMARALHLPKMIELCCSLSNAVHLAAGNTPAYVGEIYRLVRGWMARYSLIVQHVVALYARWHRALVQFALTSTGVLTTVIVHGLGTNDIYDSEETDESMQNGMGVGEGSTAGAKNVSDEIESEDQVEGLQGEEPDATNEPQTNEDAIDMDNDFEGKLGDADLETDNEDSDKDDDDDEEQEMDEQLGDVDPTDPTALDDKLWDDDDEEKDPKDEKGEENNKVDSKAKSKKEQTDIVAGDEEEEDNGKSNDPDAAGDQAEDDDDEEEQNGSGSDGSDGEDEDEGDDLDDGVNRDTFDRMADVEDQGEQLDMPEDLDMGSDNDGDDAQSDEEDDGLDADMNDLPEDEPIERKPDALDEEQAEDAENDGKDDAAEGQQADERADDQADAMDQDEISGEDDEAVDGTGEDAASDEEQGLGEEDEEEAGRGDDNEEAAKDEAEDAEESGANKPTDGVDSAMNLDGNDDADPNTTAESNDALAKPSQPTDSSQKQQQQQPAASAMQQESFMQQEDSQQQQQQQQQQPDEQQKRDLNPERTLADVIEKWERRLNIVMREKEEEEEEKDEQPDDSESQDEQKPSDADEQKQMHQDKHAAGNEDDQAAPESTDFEHVKQDEDFDKVALADAGKHDKEEQQQHQPMDVDEEEDEEEDVDDDEDSEMKDADEADDQAAGSNAAARPAMMQAAPQQLPATNNDGERAAEAAQMEQSGAEEDRREHADDSMAMETDGQEAADEQPAVDVDRLRDELEQRTADWRANKQDSEQAVELWQSYTRLTHDLSLMLTEQLRLILTPTQATQLRGDYRTGKRLNMKRIIPYIASEFRKDKIWLRRTKPARREYQVMVAVDNSKSMAQNTQAVELAYETLALVTTALNQLEVGQLSVVSFGEQVSLLHPFDTAFDSEAGARVLSRFTFADDKTDVVQLMDATLQLFASAAMHGSSSAASDLWRLQLVISDGVCQDHPRLLRQVRAAMEMRIMTVFIVLDRSAIATNAVAEALDPEKDSIMHTQHVSFVKGPGGKTEMKVQRYLDTFPFKYYVVLRNIHGLPAVLAETLRQYFSLVGSD